jgi:hypothetical protein
MAAPSAGGIQVAIDPAEWHRLKRELDKFDPALTKALRTRIRNVGNVAKAAVLAALAESSPDGGPDEGGGRAALAAATKVTVSFGKSSAGTRITTSSSRLPDQHKALLHVYNKKSFRHPVFGDRATWVVQEGRPYFGEPILKVINRAAVDEIRSALDEATKAIGARAR